MKMENIGMGLAVVGIWIGAALAMKYGATDVVFVAAGFATIFVAAFGKS